MEHDRELFAWVVSHVRELVPELRTGAMFGCPAVYVGGKLAFCVYGFGIGVKLPEAEAARLVSSGLAAPFRPFGKPAMKAWVLLPGEADIRDLLPVLLASVEVLRRTVRTHE